MLNIKLLQMNEFYLNFLLQYKLCIQEKLRKAEILKELAFKKVNIVLFQTISTDPMTKPITFIY